MSAHRIAQQMHFADIQLVNHAFQHPGVQVGTGAAVDDRIAFSPAGAVQQNDPVARLDQRVDIAAKVGPAGSPGARAVQQDHGFVALAAVIKMDA